MTVGASTSNLYPMPTEQALHTLLKLGFRDVEIFINTESEATPAFAKLLRRQADAYGATIRALHPYLSGYESYLLFSGYERRFRDGLKTYDRIFEAAAILGAELVIMHGDRPDSVLSVEESIARFAAVDEIGQAHGVHLAQENVVRYRSSDPAYLRAMKQAMGERMRFVFDVKQCGRCGLPMEQVLDAMGDAIAHVHISDRDKTHDCLLPGKGQLDYLPLLRRLQAAHFDGSLILELYRSNFEEVPELLEGKTYLDTLLAAMQAGEA